MLQSKTVKGLGLALILCVSSQSQAFFSWNDLTSKLPSWMKTKTTTITTVLAVVAGAATYYFRKRPITQIRINDNVYNLPNGVDAYVRYPHSGPMEVENAPGSFQGRTPIVPAGSQGSLAHELFSIDKDGNIYERNWHENVNDGLRKALKTLYGN